MNGRQGSSEDTHFPTSPVGSKKISSKSVHSTQDVLVAAVRLNTLNLPHMAGLQVYDP